MRAKVLLVAFGLLSGELVNMNEASACGLGDDVSPVVIRRPDTASTALLEQAALLDNRAARAETRAAQADRRADEQLVEARALRIEAASTEGRDRQRLFALAESLGTQAASARAEARQLREQAVSLRVEARATRERAFRNVGTQTGGGGWRNRKTVSATSI